MRYRYDTSSTTMCPLRKFEGGMQSLRSVDNDASTAGNSSDYSTCEMKF